MKRDFTITTYRQLLLSLKTAGYSFITFADWCEGKAVGLDKYIIVRHDIDKRAQNALKIAKIDAAFGIRSTFYWLTRKAVFHPTIIKEVAAMGHEIGYHYRDLVDTQGDKVRALKYFDHNLCKMKALVDIKTIAMVGCPLSKYNNQDLWLHFDYWSFGIIGEPYFDIFGSGNKPAVPDVFYLTDTGRMWNGNRYNIRDKVYVTPIQDYHTTFEIIAAIKEGKLPNKIMINIHPQRWTDNLIEWVLEWGIQRVKNVVKGVLVKNHKTYI